MSPSPLPPGPSSLSQAMVIARFLFGPTAFLESCQRRYGDTFTVRLSNRTMVISSDPAIAKQAFTADPDHLQAGAGNVILRPLLGPQSVLLLDGGEHLRRRRLLLPAFHGERMQAYGALIEQAAERQVGRWQPGAPFAAQPAMQAITLEVILRAVFGVSDERRLRELAQPLRRLLDATASQVRLMGLQVTSSERTGRLSPWGRLRALMAPADELLFAEIADRRSGATAGRGDDVLSMLLEARDEDGQPMTDAELRDELMTLLLAGHETTATALSWVLERVVRHPDVLARLVDEQQAGGRDYLDAVIRETLRLRPVVPAVSRYLTAPLELVTGQTLPAGVFLTPSIQLLHRRADIYADPHAFSPERFLGRTPGTYEWIPFGGGTRRCLGASFALFEMQTVLAVILRRAELAPRAARPERVTRRAITFSPSRGGQIALDALRPAA